MKYIRRYTNSKGQVTLEVGFALAAAFTLLLGAAIIFSYVNSRIVRRQQAYEVGPTGRLVAATPVPRFWEAHPANFDPVDEKGLPALDMTNGN